MAYLRLTVLQIGLHRVIVFKLLPNLVVGGAPYVCVVQLVKYPNIKNIYYIRLVSCSHQQ